MYYGSEDVEKALRCSFCREKFTDVVKLISDCGNMICGVCHEILRDFEPGHNQFKCKAEGCRKTHQMPRQGFPECRQLLTLLRSKPVEKPLSEKAKKLKQLVREIEDQLGELKAFDAVHFVNEHCDLIELEVNVAVDSAVKHLKKIEATLLEHINAYRDKCIARAAAAVSTSKQTQSGAADSTRRALADLTQGVGAFNSNWNRYFNKLDAFADDDAIETALDLSHYYKSEMRSLGDQMRMDALDWEPLVFQVNPSFVEKLDHIGEINSLINSDSSEECQKSEDCVKSQPQTPPQSANLTRPNQSAKSAGAKASNEAMASKNETTNATCLQGKRQQDMDFVSLVGHVECVQQVLFLPDGRLVSCSNDASIKIWSVESGRELFELRGHAGYVLAVASLPCGRLASASSDKTIKIWDLEQMKEVRTIRGHSASVTSLRVLKSGHLASYSADDTIKVWSLDSKEDKPVATIKGHGNRAGGNNNNNNSSDMSLFGLMSNDCLVSCSDVDSNEQGGSSIVRLWNPKDGKLVKSLPVRVQCVNSLLVLSNDEIVLGSDNGTISIVNLADRAPRPRSKENAACKITALVQLSDQTLLSDGVDASLVTIRKVWNLLDLTLLHTVNTGHFNVFFSLSLSPDKQLVACGGFNSAIKLWQASRLHANPQTSSTNPNQPTTNTSQSTLRSFFSKISFFY